MRELSSCLTRISGSQNRRPCLKNSLVFSSNSHCPSALSERANSTLIPNSCRSSATMYKGTEKRSEKHFQYGEQVHSQQFKYKCSALQILWSYFALLGGSNCMTQSTSGMSTPRAITSVQTRTPLQQTQGNQIGDAIFLEYNFYHVLDI